MKHNQGQSDICQGGCFDIGQSQGLRVVTAKMLPREEQITVYQYIYIYEFADILILKDLKRPI